MTNLVQKAVGSTIAVLLVTAGMAMPAAAQVATGMLEEGTFFITPAQEGLTATYPSEQRFEVCVVSEEGEVGARVVTDQEEAIATYPNRCVEVTGSEIAIMPAEQLAVDESVQGTFQVMDSAAMAPAQPEPTAAAAGAMAAAEPEVAVEGTVLLEEGTFFLTPAQERLSARYPSAQQFEICVVAEEGQVGARVETDQEAVVASYPNRCVEVSGSEIMVMPAQQLAVDDTLQGTFQIVE